MKLPRPAALGVPAAIGVSVLGCSSPEKPLATYGENVLTQQEFVDELAAFLPPGRSLEDVGITPENFLRRLVGMRILLDEARQTVPELSPLDRSRLDLHGEDLIKNAILDEITSVDSEVTPEAIQRRYLEIAGEERSIRVLSSPVRALIEEAWGQIRDGAAFRDVSAQMQAAHAGEVSGREIEFARQGQLPPSIERAAWSLSLGGVSPPFEAGGATYLVQLIETRRTPLETLREEIVEDLRAEARRNRVEGLEGELLATARYRVESSTSALAAARFAEKRDSLDLVPDVGYLPAAALFTREELELPLFWLSDRAFPLGEALAALQPLPPSKWPRGASESEIERLARQRALSVVLLQVAETRGILERPEFQQAMEWKRQELMVNTVLRDLWRDTRPTEAEVREALAAQGVPDPSAAQIGDAFERISRQRQTRKLDQHVRGLSERLGVRYYDERLPEAMSRLEKMRQRPSEAAQ
jgi:hypothetical protein